ncbi:hypothetical protein [Mesorhizobium sp. B2-1-2]|uniref:hypothetical protein n=1 Tax=Mesorhizobium sp. B2-1-2 TaxID=2589973 RepID=UPI001127398E|nr:hypothetical protein [Mesorhizobium sp. B2-1-2]TPN04515.1 hypothetical protein FJ971_29660 [Mesorhizobium sp. B2-1-2]
MLTHSQTVAAFNEWMRRFTEEPERFEGEFKSAKKFLADTAAGREPTYGETSAAYLQQLASEIGQ